MRNKLALLIGLLFMGIAQAATIDAPLADAAQEKTSRNIFRELRCMVCEGQSLAESDATLAIQMRQHVRDMVHAGRSQAEVLDYFAKRYGEHILMTPRVNERTALLWLAPVLLLLIGGFALWRMTRPVNGGSHD